MADHDDENWRAHRKLMEAKIADADLPELRSVVGELLLMVINLETTVYREKSEPPPPELKPSGDGGSTGGHGWAGGAVSGKIAGGAIKLVERSERVGTGGQFTFPAAPTEKLADGARLPREDYVGGALGDGPSGWTGTVIRLVTAVDTSIATKLQRELPDVAPEGRAERCKRIVMMMIPETYRRKLEDAAVPPDWEAVVAVFCTEDPIRGFVRTEVNGQPEVRQSSTEGVVSAVASLQRRLEPPSVIDMKASPEALRRAFGAYPRQRVQLLSFAARFAMLLRRHGAFGMNRDEGALLKEFDEWVEAAAFSKPESEER